MEKFKEGSSRPQSEETLQDQIRKKVTPELTYMKGSVVLKGARIEKANVYNLKTGDYLFDNKTWNCIFKGSGQLVVPIDKDYNESHKEFEGYAILKDGKCEKICNIINIKN